MGVGASLAAAQPDAAAVVAGVGALHGRLHEKYKPDTWTSDDALQLANELQVLTNAANAVAKAKVADTAKAVAKAADAADAPAEQAAAEEGTEVDAGPPAAYDQLDMLFTQGVVGLDDSADIRLLDAVHVIETARAGGRFQKRQDLPSSAFLTERPTYIIALSYAWLTKGDPDPDGWHIGIVGPLLDLFVRSATAANDGAAVSVGFFIDFCCLWQAPRTEAQQASFDRGLGNVNYLYANRKVFVWAQTKMPPGTERDYWARGWTFFELTVASIIKEFDIIHPRHPGWKREDKADREDSRKGLEAFANARLLDLAKLEPSEREIKMGLRGRSSAIDPKEQEDFHRIACTCSGGVHRPPVSLDVFREELGRRSFTNGKSDADAVAELYSRTLDEVLGAVTELRFTDVGWRDEDFVQLATVLPRCAKLRKLELYKNGQVTDKGAAAVVANLPASVRDLSLDGSRATCRVPGTEGKMRSTSSKTFNTPELIKYVHDFYANLASK